jgi:hypothetical protein
MALHQFWPADQELGAMIAQSRGNVDNRLYRLRGQCCLSMSIPDECIESAHKLLKNNPSPDDTKFAHLLIVGSYILRADYNKADDAAQKTGDGGLRRSCRELIQRQANAKAKANSGQVDEAAKLDDHLLRNSPKVSHILLARESLVASARRRPI